MAIFSATSPETLITLDVTLTEPASATIRLSNQWVVDTNPYTPLIVDVSPIVDDVESTQGFRVTVHNQRVSRSKGVGAPDHEPADGPTIAQLMNVYRWHGAAVHMRTFTKTPADGGTWQKDDSFKGVFSHVESVDDLAITLVLIKKLAMGATLPRQRIKDDSDGQRIAETEGSILPFHLGPSVVPAGVWAEYAGHLNVTATSSQMHLCELGASARPGLKGSFGTGTYHGVPKIYKQERSPLGSGFELYEILGNVLTDHFIDVDGKLCRVDNPLDDGNAGVDNKGFYFNVLNEPWCQVAVPMGNIKEDGSPSSDAEKTIDGRIDTYSYLDNNGTDHIMWEPQSIYPLGLQDRTTRPQVWILFVRRPEALDLDRACRFYIKKDDGAGGWETVWTRNIGVVFHATYFAIISNVPSSLTLPRIPDPDDEGDPPENVANPWFWNWEPADPHGRKFFFDLDASGSGAQDGVRVAGVWMVYRFKLSGASQRRQGSNWYGWKRI